MKRRNALLTLGAPLLLPSSGQGQTDILVKISGGQMPVIAVPDFRGGGAAQSWMTLFNQTLFDEIYTSGVFKVAPKSFYPLRVPQQPRTGIRALGRG